MLPTMNPELFAWNPRPYVFRGKMRRLIPLRRRTRLNNFGDLLGPIVVKHMLTSRGLVAGPETSEKKLLSVGSVMHFASDGDVIWGTGVNGKIPASAHRYNRLDIRAVRGPLTREYLARRGIRSPEIYGDPGLLVPEVYPHLKLLAGEARSGVVVVPNLNDWATYAGLPEVVDPRSPLMSVLERIARAEFVVGSSLHGVVVAESLGIPARLIVSASESPFKYLDYYRGSGRAEYRPAGNLKEAMSLGGEPAIAVDFDSLKGAFPYDYWK